MAGNSSSRTLKLGAATRFYAHDSKEDQITQDAIELSDLTFKNLGTRDHLCRCYKLNRVD